MRFIFHDCDSYSSGMHNCLSIPFDYLLEKGFKTRQTDVRPAASVNTAMQLVQSYSSYVITAAVRRSFRYTS